jgi:hypothetical protein
VAGWAGLVPARASREDDAATDTVELPGVAGLGTAPLGSGPERKAAAGGAWRTG